LLEIFTDEGVGTMVSAGVNTADNTSGGVDP
jgi:hypothetical protein